MEFPHPHTLLLCVIVIATTTGALLLVSSRQNRNETALLIWGLSNLVGAVGLCLLAARGRAPDWLTIDIANAAIILFHTLGLAGALRFARQDVSWSAAWIAPWKWALLPPLLWVALCQWPGFKDSVEWRLVVLSGIVVATCLATAAVFLSLKGERLVSRYPIVGWHVVHALVYLVRMIPPLTGAVPASNQITASPLMTLVFFEALVHVTMVSFLQLSLAKDRAEDRYRHAAETDVLTGQPNRRAFMERAEELIASPGRWPACMLLVDVDRFKAINDSAGHAGGDAVLVKVAETIRSHLRPADTFGRLGGEEFACLLPNTSLQSAAVIAEGMRARIANLDIHTGSGTVRVSVSIGVSALASGPVDLDHLIDRADACLYEAKRAGRNRVVARDDGMRLAG